MANTTENGSEPINFRAALAAFEQNSNAAAPSRIVPAGLPSPKPRPQPAAASRAPPHTPARASSGSDPVPRSSSTPRIRKNSDGLLPPSSHNPFSYSASPTLAPSSIPTTSASGMLSAPSPTLPTAVSPMHAPSTPLRKSGSGLSLHELTSKSLPRGSGASGSAASPRLTSRNRLLAENHDTSNCNSNGNSSSAPASGRSSPYLPPRTVIGLFGTKDDSGAPRRTDSPSSQHMLDTSADDDMFAHAVMQRSSAPASPDRKAAIDSYLPPPPQVPSRKGSASSANSASTPRLPPRPAGGGASTSLAPSPTISEFGAFPTPKGKAGLGYATYTPGSKRAQNGLEGSMTPPALPPRSATLGQTERGRAADTPYKARHKSPMKHAPAIPQKPSAASKPAPPPRPAKNWEGGAGGFRFGSTSSEDTTATQPPPPPRQRTAVHNRSLTGSSSSHSTTHHTNAHRKTGSNVFTSISLSDDASSELKHSLESDLHADHPHQLPPPSRGRTSAYPPSSNRGSGATGGAGGPGGVVSSLIGTAASALPLFKSSAAAFGAPSRSLADGAPSKQPHYSGGVAVSRSASAHSDLSVRPGEGGELWAGTRVELADSTAGVYRTHGGGGVLKEPKDEAARRRYEALFDELLVKERARAAKRGTGDHSNASTVRENRRDDAKSSGVQALRGWFESDSAHPTTSHPSTPNIVGDANTTNDAAVNTTSISDTSAPAGQVVSARTVRKIWLRSHLAPSFLAQVWESATHSQPSSCSSASSSSSSGGLGREAFVRGLASLDFELERKRHRRLARGERRSKTKDGTRRVPPPPRAPAPVV